MANIQNGNELINVDVFQTVGINQGMSVGDLGCGNLGYFTLTAARMVGKKGIVYAVDLMKPALMSVQSRAQHEGLENVKVVWSNLEIYGATGIPAASLDVAMIHNVLFHTGKAGEVIRESARLMKSGAKLLVIDWLKTGAPFGPPPSERIDPDDVKVPASVAGLSLISEFVAGPYHFGLIFQK